MKNLFLLLMTGAISACGVKGDPVAPITPAEIGTGKPVFKSEPEEKSLIPKRKDWQKEQDEEIEEE